MRTTVSEKNKYYVGKERMLELKHFCLQYPIWVEARERLYKAVNSSNYIDLVKKDHPKIDPVAKTYESIDKFNKKIEMVDWVVNELNAVSRLGKYILKGVTEGRTYTWLKTNMDIPCGRDEYYKWYRTFFYYLNKIRD